MRLTNLASLLALASLPSPACSKTAPKNAILLSEVQSLTLRGAPAQTTHRRVSPISQLTCASSPQICRLHTIDVLRCTNQGSGYDTEDIQWSCEAALPPELKLGSTDVICEGYAGPDDPYVLKGSCGVEYRLVLTELGEEKFPDIANGGGSGSGGWFGGGGGGNNKGQKKEGDNKDNAPDISAWLFGIIFVGVCVWILYSAWTSATDGPRAGPVQRRPRGVGGGGGGPGFGGGGGYGGGYGGFSDDDPPPPYTAPKYSSSSQAQSQAQQGWRPGFWSGTAAGAAAGYMAGNRGSSSGQGTPRATNSSSGGGGWGSTPSSSSGSGSSSGSTSSSRYTSTGFGSTNRR
ncbi:Uu.00g082150.m01.CDS01 [Anthostomella pinea]|uniref:Store-operated calcium entry-associated regulatory factor n=1 Tax=Anthostomella pinea TaxID=933095 RepID=A0AAI8VLB1_9PEZI|nr:Uu.00g082150.m01.CDS01 [Anthostomella pinea]